MTFWDPIDAVSTLLKTGNIGSATGHLLGGIDITPGYKVFGNVGTKSTPSKPSSAPVAAPKNDSGSNPDASNGYVDYGGQYVGGTATPAAPAHTAADEKAYYNDQISALDKLLGLTNTQKSNGLDRLDSSFDSQNRRLKEQQTKAMNGYDQQNLQNAQDKQHGIESVDSFANNSYNSLQRLLQGANAGNSSVGRELIPYLISKGAGTRRSGVFDQAGRNDQNIASARGDAKDQFKYSMEDLGNQRKSQEESFLEGILNKQSDLYSQKRALQIQAAQADGSGYEDARKAGEASQNSIDDRMSQLNSLFGKFNPTFNAHAVNLKTPDLGQFTVDPAQIKGDQNLPAESRYYLPQLKKKQDGLVAGV